VNDESATFHEMAPFLVLPDNVFAVTHAGLLEDIPEDSDDDDDDVIAEYGILWHDNDADAPVFSDDDEREDEDEAAYDQEDRDRQGHGILVTAHNDFIEPSIEYTGKKVRWFPYLS
jgi:hypothetical protein